MQNTSQLTFIYLFVITGCYDFSVMKNITYGKFITYILGYLCKFHVSSIKKAGQP